MLNGLTATRQRIIMLGVFLLYLVYGYSHATQAPNILIILADDLGFSDIGCYGSEISTPNLDRLANQGIKFTQFYNAARCCPSRAALLSGVYPHQAGIGEMVVEKVKNRDQEHPYQGWLSRQTLTIAEALRPRGYATYLAGKWHVGEETADWPLQRGFDHFWGLISGANSYYDLLPKRTLLEDNANFIPKDNFYMTDATTDKAILFIEQSRLQYKPFFLYLAYTAPHWPLHAPESEIQKYLPIYRQGWELLREQRLQKQKRLKLIDSGVTLSPLESDITGWELLKDKDEWARKMATYAAMVHLMDAGIGRVIQQLASNKQLDNTLILFLSDNGACAEVIDKRAKRDLGDERYRAATEAVTGSKASYVAYGKPWAALGNTPFKRYKQYTHEGGIASPLIVHFPRMIKKPFQTDQVGHVIDLMPTCLDVAGANYPAVHQGNPLKPLEGKSLIPIFKGKKWRAGRSLGWEHFDCRAFRKGDWKIVWSKQEKKWELYNLKKDRAEQHDLAHQNPEQLQNLICLYTEWAERVGVNAPRILPSTD